MSGNIPQNLIEQIKDRSSLLQIVSEFVALKKAGTSYKGLCPFHQEKTPSFTVNEEKGVFHCFGCGAGGNVFHFLMKISQLSFPQAVEELARRAQISLPRRTVSPEEDRKRTKLFQINELATEHFCQILLDAKEAEAAREYFNVRGISDNVIKQYKLGYALGKWDGLVQVLRSAHIPLELAREAGLIVAKGNGGYYDRFRNRVMFPIVNVQAKTIGFGGRIFNQQTATKTTADKDEPKYLNSPESPIFIKGRTFYGLNVAKDFISKSDAVIIVEGYFDLLSLHQNDIQYAVATLGTALTIDHIAILRRYTKNIIVVFDGDEAGERALHRSLESFLDAGLMPKAIILPREHDPDTYIRTVKKEGFISLLNSARPLLDIYIDKYLQNPQRGIEAVVAKTDAVVPMLVRVKNPIERSLYIRSVAERLGIDEGILKGVINSPRRRSPEQNEKKEKAPMISHHPKAERTLVKMLLNCPGAVEQALGSGIISYFTDTSLKIIAESILEHGLKDGKIDLSHTLSCLDDENLRSLLTSIDFEEESWSPEEWEKVFKECLTLVKLNYIHIEKRILSKEIRQAQEKGDSGILMSLLSKKDALVKRERSLRSAT